MSEKKALIVIDMKKQKYTEVVLCGLDECGCVGATAKGAVKTGVKVVMLENCIGSRFPDEKVQKLRKELNALGVRYEDSDYQAWESKL